MQNMVYNDNNDDIDDEKLFLWYSFILESARSLFQVEMLPQVLTISNPDKLHTGFEPYWKLSQAHGGGQYIPLQHGNYDVVLIIKHASLLWVYDWFR